MTNKIALVLGATGLVGGEVLKALVKDSRYKQINCIVRHPVGLESNKIRQSIIKPSAERFEWHQYAESFAVDHVYVCLGTTIKKAGSKKAFREIDFDLVYQAALISIEYDVRSFVWVSSVGADASSHNFYLQVKGELEQAIYQLEQLNAVAVRPSLLLGDRQESRPAEQIGSFLVKLVSPFLIGSLAKYKPVQASEVAKQMIELQRF
ncbi:NAD(P)H-binding protein [Aliiglaciecola sp. LCG003]|uniref:NAD(P)H-binding protein n=1 Tax=Aliiglaciecola sp. LCG003 TaxID=3053655 RepID=UPI002572E3AB|nr:NAD(P)H-binding protein [Aliiglaciecola sp. LCG003]WJG08976.1 epimerase [Aliiglaciecola sp. LCG003]